MRIFIFSTLACCALFTAELPAYVEESNATKVQMIEDLNAEIRVMKEQAVNKRSECELKAEKPIESCDEDYNRLMLDISEYYDDKLQEIKFLGHEPDSSVYYQRSKEEKELDSLLEDCLIKNSQMQRDCIGLHKKGDAKALADFISKIPEFRVDYNSLPEEPNYVNTDSNAK